MDIKCFIIYGCIPHAGSVDNFQYSMTYFNLLLWCTCSGTNEGSLAVGDASNCPFVNSGLPASAVKQATQAMLEDVQVNTVLPRKSPTSESFPYEDFFHEQIMKKKNDHSYRIFKKVNRLAAEFPSAKEYSWGERPITVWCSNDYLGMSCHPEVKRAVQYGKDKYLVFYTR